MGRRVGVSGSCGAQRAALEHYLSYELLKKNVAGCELCGVRACCMLTWRAGMLPIVFLTMRIPITAGDTPTVPMLKTLSTMIFQISWAVLSLSSLVWPPADR